MRFVRALYGKAKTLAKVIELQPPHGDVVEAS